MSHETTDKNKKAIIIDPSTGLEIHPYFLLQRTCATVCLQRFYRHYIKWERDAAGRPIDPILKDGFDPKDRVRILYKTRIDNKYVTRLQIFDIETLWEAIGHYKENMLYNCPINPITNTPFSYQQFKIIVEKAGEIGLISKEVVDSKLKNFQHGTDFGYKLRSKFEPGAPEAFEDIEVKAKQIRINRDQQLLAYFALIDDFPMVEKIIYKHITDINDDLFDINLKRNPQHPLSIFPNVKQCQSQKSLLYMINERASIFTANDDTCIEGPTAKEEVFPVSTHTTSEELNMDDIVIDASLEKSPLLNYVKCYNAIQACCFNGNKDMLMLLLQMGGDLCIQDTISNVLPIHLALLEKRIEILKVLIFYGVREQLEIPSKFGTALELANNCLSEIPEIYSILFAV